MRIEQVLTRRVHVARRIRGRQRCRRECRRDRKSGQAWSAHVIELLPILRVPLDAASMARMRSATEAATAGSSLRTDWEARFFGTRPDPSRRGRGSCEASSMRFTSVLAALLVLAFACTQKTETVTSTDSTGTVQTKTTTVTATVPAIDTTATAQIKQDAKDAVNNAKDAAKDGANATATPLEKAGKEIQKKTKKN